MESRKKFSEFFNFIISFFSVAFSFSPNLSILSINSKISDLFSKFQNRIILFEKKG